MTRRRTLRYALGLGNGLLVLAIGLAAAVIWALRTQSGAEFAVAQIIARVPGELSVGQTEGNFADGVNLRNVVWQDGQGLRVEAASAALHVAIAPLLDRDAQVQSLTLSDLRVTLPPSGEPKPLQVPTLRAPLPIDVAALAIDGLTVVREDTETRIDTVRAALAWRDTDVTLRELAVTAPAWRVTAAAESTLDGDVPLAGTVAWSLPEREIEGEATLAGTLAALQIEHTLRGPLTLSSDGEVVLLGELTPRVDLTHRCERGCAGDAADVRAATLTQRGTLSDYAYELDARIAVAPLPSSSLRAAGRGSLQAIDIASLELKGPAGNVRGAGRVRFPPELEFALRGRAEGVTLETFAPAVRGKVATDFDVSGRGADALSARLSALRGTLNGYALAGSADVAREGRQWRLRNVDARAGDNRLRGSGRIGPRTLQLDATVDAPRLEQVATTWRGAVQGELKLSGDRRNPVIDADLRAQGVEVAGWSATEAVIDVRATTDGAVSGSVRAAGVARDGRPLGAATAELGGTLDDALIDVDWRWRENALDTMLRIVRTPGGAVVTVRDATAALEAVGDWRLGARFDVTIDGPRITVGAHAWRQADAGLTIEQITVAPERLTLGATLTDLPLAPLNDWLTPGLRIEGRADGRVDLRRERGTWRGTVDWRQRDTLLRYQAKEGVQQLRLETVSVQGRIDDTDGSVTLALSGDHGTRAQAQVDVSGVGGDATLTGQATARIDELAWLGRLFPGAGDIAGELALDLSASGPARRPELEGRIAWRNGSLALTDLGTQLTDIQIVGEGTSASRLTLTGSALAGGGRIEVRGTLDEPLTAARRLALEVDGKDVKIAGADGYEVWVSPDLSLQANADKATVSGRIDVPRARVRVKSLPEGAVAQSQDVQVAGRPDREALELPVSGRIELVLGDDVHIEALGLDSDVRGDVTASLRPGREPRFEGRLYLENGEFRAYGQDLTIDRGNLFFSGSIRNPTLDVQATRRINEPGGTVVAGVRVSGPAENYRVDVYSEPALPPTEALSYLMLGRSSVDAGGQDGETLSRTAFALGLSRSSPITTQIASGLGLDELSVAGGNLDDAELVAGKQLNDDLYVRFTYGVFSELGALLLRYRLSKRLALEVGSADTQSVDLLYSLEK